MQEEKYLVIQSMALARRREIKKEKEQKTTTTKENVSKSVKFKEEVFGYCLLEVEPQLVPYGQLVILIMFSVLLCWEFEQL